MRRPNYFSAIIFIVALHVAVSVEGAQSVVDHCGGYIEIVSSSHMERFRVPSGPPERIASATGILVDGFDVSRDGSKRVIETMGDDDFRLLIYTDSKVNTVTSKSFIRKPIFSPDGKSIAYLQGTPSVQSDRLQEA